MRAPVTDNPCRLSRLRREDGALLLEVIFSTLVVAMVSAAVLTGVSGSVTTATKNRERSVAASLAEQDQERMRSYKATELDGYSATTTKTVRGIQYQVASSTAWYFDSSGTKSCTSNGNKASYLRLISTVTPLGNRPGAAVTETSLLAPPNGTLSTTKGALAVMIVDRSGNPRPNIVVSLNGGSVAQSDTTNSSGCANFFNLPVGSPATTYTVTPSAPGLVDRSGDSSPTLATGVVGGQQTLVTMELDVPVTINVAFDTKVGTNAAVPWRSQYARLVSSGLPSPSFLQGSLGSYPTTNNTFQWTSLYPFTSGYAAYAGNCDANDPTDYGSAGYSTAVTPGGGPYTITARMPSLNLRVQRSGVDYAGADVKVYQFDTGCSQTPYPTQLTNSSGAIPNPGYPWGNYWICVDDNRSSPVLKWVNLLNTSAAGTATTTVSLTSGTTSGSC
jgi:type II secretory pathway pseudopilin PulG